jgi:AcrR family transcriptional regulator
MEMSERNDTEQTILKVAEVLFLKRGYAQTSTTEIAREARCNQSLIHYYYRTKENLFTRIYEKKLSLFLSDFINGSKSNLSFREKIRRMIEAHFDALINNPQLPFFIFTELLSNDKRLDMLKESLKMHNPAEFKVFCEEFQDEISKGNIREMSVFDLIILILSLNVMLILGIPIIKKLVTGNGETFDNFLSRRRKENVRIILQSLNP